MEKSPVSFNRMMIGIGAVIVVLMVVNAGFMTAGHVRVARKCHDGDLKACTALIEAKQTQEKERGQYFAIRGFYNDKNGQLDQAISDYGNAISRVPPQPALYANRAATYMKRARYDEAIADYNSALGLAARAPLLYCGRADAEYHKGDSAHGDADMTQAAKLDPRAACLAAVQRPAAGTMPAIAPAASSPAMTAPVPASPAH